MRNEQKDCGLSCPSGNRVQALSSHETVRDASVVWEGVVSGRLRVVESYERQRRRYLVVRPSREGGAPGISARERRALSLRAQGCALKVIAFELAVSLATAARDVKRAMALLGLQSAAELAAVFNHGER